MYKWILLVAFSLVTTEGMAKVGDLNTVEASVRERIEIAIKSGYSVAECRDGECRDFETGEIILIDDYDKDGFYIYWDEEKPGRNITDTGLK